MGPGLLLLLLTSIPRFFSLRHHHPSQPSCTSFHFHTVFSLFFFYSNELSHQTPISFVLVCIRVVLSNLLCTFFFNPVALCSNP
ncbi:hypothetical protein K435DRAFT_288958 [Dendrothele bispora CBS 962.96]|uniref:Uncharacterized protein n=1 Tax=Dendrothele bispora (strain CBS 962.96) TaxID=1314807 RepID=A0A4S8LJQ1_DENBC|nr:hypothetical protein K435DRAFT_288958 [Dendrothele bispora CBS 962.96]